MNINLNYNIDVSELTGVIIKKVLEFKNIILTKNEADELINMIINDEEVIKKMNNLIKLK